VISLNSIGSSIGTAIKGSIKFLGSGAAVAFSLATGVIAAAYESLGFSTSHADTFGAWYVSKTPTGNVIEDETPSRKDRTELATTGSVFDGTNYFEKTDIANADLGADDTSFTARVRFSGNGSSGVDDYIFASYDSTPDEGFRFAIIGGFLTFSIKDRALATRSATSTITTADIQAGGIYEAVGVYDAVAERISIYVNAVFHDDNVATTYSAPTQNIVRIGMRTDTTSGQWFGNIYEAQVWNDQALTSAEIVKLWDKEISYFQGDKAPSVAWLLDGPTCVDLIGDNDLTPVADPAAYVGSLGSTWLNDQGYNTAYNLATYSEEMNLGATKARITVLEDAIENHLGDLTADKIIETTDTGSHQLRKNYLVSGVQNTFSIYVKAGERSHFGIQLGPSSSTGVGFDLSDGSTFDVGVNIDSATATDVGDGWWKLVVTATPGSTLAYLSICDGNTDQVASYTGDGTSGLYLWGLQIVEGDTLPAYYKTRATAYDNVIVPKQWDLDTDTNSVAALDANSFGPCKRNREYRNGPAITLDGTMGADTTYDGSDLTELSVTARIMVTDTTGDQTVVDQSTGLTGWGFRVQEIDATTSELFFFHYPKAGGAADTMATATAIVTKDVAHVIGVSWDAVTGDADFYVDEIKESESQTDNTGGILADAAPMRIGLPNDTLTGGLRGKLWDLRIFEKKITDDEFKWVRTQGVSGTEPTNMVRHWPVIEEVGVKIQDVVAGDVATFTNDPTWDFTANDEFFHGETVGYSSVPIFVDGVELIDGGVDYDGIKKAEVELHFFLTVGTAQSIFTNGSVGPFRVRVSSSKIQVQVRNIDNVANVQAQFDITTNTLYKIHVELIEHPTDPRNQSSCVVTDLITGNVLVEEYDCDFSLSAALTNSGNQQIGTYTNASDAFEGDLYLVKHWQDGNLKCDWVGSDYLNNAAPSISNFSETGGTLDIKKIPAASRSLDANGYPTNRPAGAYHNRTAAEMTETPVANSDSVNPIYYGASFDGTLDANINADTNIIGYPFSIECDIRFTGTGGTEQPLYVSFGTGNYFGIVKLSGGSVRIQRRATVTANTDTDFDFLAATWHSIKVDYLSATSLSVTFDGQTELHTGETSVPFPALTMDDLWVGQFRSTLGESPDFDIKNVVVKQGDTIVNDLPLYKDALDRSSNCNHGTLSATGVSFLSNVMETGTTPDIAESETRAVTSGDQKIISIGAR